MCTITSEAADGCNYNCNTCMVWYLMMSYDSIAWYYMSASARGLCLARHLYASFSHLLDKNNNCTFFMLFIYHPPLTRTLAHCGLYTLESRMREFFCEHVQLTEQVIGRQASTYLHSVNQCKIQCIIIIINNINVTIFISQTIAIIINFISIFCELILFRTKL